MNTHSLNYILGGVISILIPAMGMANSFKAPEKPNVIEAEDLVLEVVEEKLKPAEVTQDRFTKIKLSDGTVYEVESFPDKAEMKKALGLELPEKLKEKLIAKGGVIEDINPLEAYEGMEQRSQEEFEKVRRAFLENAAKALHKTQFALGAGSIIGDSFQFVKIKALKMFGKNVDPNVSLSRTFNERSHQGVNSILKSINYKLFTQAPLLIDANEFGLSLSMGIIGELGMLKKGGGGSEELGLSFGYNKKDKAFVFELFHNSEKFSSSRSFVSVLGVVGKLGLSIGARKDANIIKGGTFYPPMIPGFSANSSSYFVTGLSSTFGFPPSPFADMLTFTNDFERTPLIRITVSPLVKGFVRIHVGRLDNVVKVLVVRVADTVMSIGKIFTYNKVRTCGQVFTL